MNDDNVAGNILKYASQEELRRDLAQCPTSPNDSMGSKLQRQMTAKNLTPVSLSAKANVSRAKIQGCILGGAELSSADVIRVCRAMGLSPDFFLKPVEVKIDDMPEWVSLGETLMTFPYEQRVRVITALRNSLRRYEKGTY